MKKFTTKISNDKSELNYDFECFENTEPIEIGDRFLFFFAGSADVQECCSENEKSEINPNDREYQHDKIDMVYGFWKRCYKIKSTNFDVENHLKW